MGPGLESHQAVHDRTRMKSSSGGRDLFNPFIVNLVPADVTNDPLARLRHRSIHGNLGFRTGDRQVEAVIQRLYRHVLANRGSHHALSCDKSGLAQIVPSALGAGVVRTRQWT
jgi:hypothetical protein